MSTTCKLADSCQIIINGKDKEIKERNNEIEELKTEIEEYKTKEKILKGFLAVQGVLLFIAFQIWN